MTQVPQILFMNKQEASCIFTDQHVSEIVAANNPEQ